MTKRAPVKHRIMLNQSNREGTSFRIKTDMMMAKKGESLFSMFASARIRWSIAQKFARIPTVPKKERSRRSFRQPSWIRKGSPLLARLITAMPAAIRFRNRDFCMVGMSPASLTKILIMEKKKAARRIQRMPALRL
jgi:hypothetical protein